jgi:hypothetical protein
MGCESPVGPRAVAPTRVDPEWVVGAAAAAVDPETGLFLLAPALDAELDVAAARSLALAYLPIAAYDGPFSSRGVVEQDRGKPINWNSLEPCGRTYRVSSAFGPHPESVPRQYHRINAAQWVVSFCGPNDVEVSISVSDAPRSLEVVNDSLVWAHPDSLDGVFTVTGVPAQFPSGIPLPPEDAVAYVFAMTNTRISEAPEPFDQLGPPGIGQLPLCASWRLVFEQPVSVIPVAGGPVELVNELFVRHEPACFATTIALYAADTPVDASVWVRYATRPAGVLTIDSVLVDAQGPTRFHRVNAVPED